VRIGVVADTHVGEHLPRLPPEVPDLLGGVDLILHAGDICEPAVLDELGELAPVVAVRGNHDDLPGVAQLPRDIVVRVGDVRIGLTHGTRRSAVELSSGLLSLVVGRPLLLGFDHTMLRRFRDVDCIVVGHLHTPIDTEIDGVRLFSPGAVYVPELGAASEPRGARGWAYRRYRGGLAPADRLPSIGVIEIGPDGLTTRRVLLEHPIAVMRR
jgi:putative phosphoesterase